MFDWLDEIHEGTDEIQSIQTFLTRLGNSFSMVGNNNLAEDLWRASQKLGYATKRINNALSKSINDGLEKSEKDLKETFELVLGNLLPEENNV